MNEELTPSEEQALDALLSELHGKSGPPDLSGAILARLDQVSDTMSSPSIESTARRGTSGTSSAGKQFVIGISLVAVLAATLLIALSIHFQQKPSGDDSVHVAEVNDQTPDRDLIAGQTPRVADVVPETPVSPPKIDDPPRSRSLPMVVADPAPGSSLTDPSESLPRVPSSSEAVTLVSADVDSEMQKYWEAIGIQPSGEASNEETANRLAIVLGVDFAPEAVGDPELAQQELAGSAAARAVARRWLRQITGGGLGRINEQARERLVAEVAESFQSKRSFDQLLADWISGKSDHTSSFYASVSVGGENQMVRRLASLTMNVDLRCVQCHDALIESKGRQEDYWSFAAFLRHGLQRQQNRWTVARKKSPKAVFYDQPDGIRKVAEAAVASDWMPQQEPITTIGQWSNALVGSPELARGIVNSLWQLVHGEPLQGHVIDAITAPHDDSLDRLEQRLTTDLVQSRFDIGRTLALIITSPATNRSVPEALRPENALVSSEEEIQSAMASVNAFAAALPPRQYVSLDRRLDVAMRRIGAKIDDVDSVLAQGTGEPSSTEKKPTRNRPKLGHDFPGKGATLPVQWLSTIKSDQNSVQYRQRVEHLGYLAGMSDVSSELLNVADSIQEVDPNGDLALQRVWWLVRP